MYRKTDWIELEPKFCEYCDESYYHRIKTEKAHQFKRRRFCSNKCKIKALAEFNIGKIAHNNNRQKRVCINCGREDMVSPAFSDRPYCGRDCMAEHYSKFYLGERASNWQGGKLSRNCKICGSVFEFDKGDLKRRNISRIYCSIRCKAIDAMKKQKKKDTDIEILLENWLKENNIAYKKQEIIENLTIVDFFIPPNICLYADGDYWHDFERTKIKDIEQTNTLTERGYVVYRLKGSEIKNGVRPDEILCKS